MGLWNHVAIIVWILSVLIQISSLAPTISSSTNSITVLLDSTGKTDIHNVTLLLYQAPGSSAIQTIPVDISKTSPIEVQHLTPGVTYRLVVQVAFKNGSIEIHSNQNVTTKPLPPSSVSVSLASTESLHLSVTANTSSHQDSYYIEYVDISNNSAVNHVTTSIESPVLSSLGAGHVYRIKVSSVSNGERSLQPITIQNNTVPLPPTINGLFVKNTTHFQVVWSPNTLGEQTSFIILFNNQEDELTCILYECEGLVGVTQHDKPGKRYNVQMKAVQGVRDSVLSTNQSVNTRPGQPGEIAVENRTSTALYITWGSPVPDSVFDKFNVTVSSNSRDVDPGTQSANIQSLKAGEKYIVSITAISNGVSSEPRTVTLYTKPKAPGKPTVEEPLSDITNTSVIVSLHHPLAPPGAYDEFKVEISPHGSNTESPKMVSSNMLNPVVTFQTLVPGKLYNITTYTSSGGQALSEPSPVLSINTKPEPSQYLEVINGTVTTSNFNISWQPPPYEYDSYYLTIEPVGGKLSSYVLDKAKTDRQVMFNGLSSGVLHHITIQSVAGTQKSAPVAVDVITLPSDVTGLKRGTVASHYIEVLWDQPNTTFDHYELYIVPSPHNLQLPLIIHRGTNNKYTFEDLQPGMRYNISIITVRSFNARSMATYRIISTKPLPVVDMTTSAHGTDSIVVSWRVRPASNQRKFMIVYTGVSVPVQEMEEVLYHNMRNDYTWTLRNQIQPGHLYSISVQAVSYETYSEEVVKNQTSKPSPVESLHAVPESETTGNVSWTTANNSRQDEFTIKFMTDLDAEWRVASTRQLKKTLTRLPAGDLVTVQVIAFSNAVPSAPEFTTFITYPYPPDHVSVYHNGVTTHSIHLQWLYVNVSSHVTSYHVYYNEQYLYNLKHAKVKNVTGGDKSVIIDHLGAGKNYTFQVYAVTINFVESLYGTTTMATVKPICDSILREDLTGTTNASVAFTYNTSSGEFDHYRFCLTAECKYQENRDKLDHNQRVVFNKDIIPGQMYQAHVYTVSGSEVSEAEKLLVRAVPNRVTLISNTNPATTTSVRLEWHRPYGVVSYYEINCPTCPTSVGGITGAREKKVLQEPAKDVYDLKYTSLKPYTTYEFYIVAVTGMGNNEKKSAHTLITVRTEPSAPSAVLDFTVRSKSATEVELTWTAPRNPNGRILGYNVTYEAQGNGQVYKGWKQFSHVNSNSTMQTKTISGLKGGLQYTFIIKAWTHAGLGNASVRVVDMPTTAPEIVISEVPNVDNGSDAIGTSSIAVELTQVFSEDYGAITGYSIIVVEVDRLNADIDTEMATLPKWGQINSREVWPPYEANGPCEVFNNANCDGALSSNRKKRAAAGTKAKFMIGAENCNYKAHDEFCNGPLRPDREYQIALRAYTSGGHKTTHLSQPFKTAVSTPTIDSTSVVTILLSILIPMLFIAVIFGVLIFLKRRGYILRKDSIDGSNGGRNLDLPALHRSFSRSSSRKKRSMISRPVRIDQFGDHVRLMMKDSDFRYSEEYEDLRQVGREQSTNAAELPENRAKNRFTNILPYDWSRVKLLPTDDEDGSDYINSNYMPGYNSKREFIVTQGPLPSTVDDFWRMTWEQNCRSIVMLTKYIEKGREKCHPYLPTDPEPTYYADIQVCLLNETRMPEWTITEFETTKGDTTRKLVHFHFTAWPDFGVPERPQSLIKFVRTVRSRCPKDGPPIAIHCSAGVGRSGTFITLDRLLQHIVEHHDTVDIFGIVHEMRKHRVWMVQTEQQYICIHQSLQCVLEGNEDYDNQLMSEGFDNGGFEDDEGISTAETP